MLFYQTSGGSIFHGKGWFDYSLSRGVLSLPFTEPLLTPRATKQELSDLFSPEAVGVLNVLSFNTSNIQSPLPFVSFILTIAKFQMCTSEKQKQRTKKL